ncbi:hypothetical protein D3C83_317770 [compost metagenome]
MPPAHDRILRVLVIVGFRVNFSFFRRQKLPDSDQRLAGEKCFGIFESLADRGIQFTDR